MAAATVAAMTNRLSPDTPPTPRTCGQCGHLTDDHVLLLVVQTPPCGLMLCPAPGCACGSTWRANTQRSTPEEIAETRQLVRDALIRDGYPLPAFLEP